MESIGARLRKARKKKGLTLDDAQKALKLHPSILKSLEEDNASQFISPVYIRAFIKSYARYLELDSEKIASEYSKKRAEETEQVLYVGPKDQELWRNLKKYLPLAVKVISAVLIVVVLLSIISGIGRSLKSFAKRRARTRQARSVSPTVKKPAINIPKNKPLRLVVKTKEDVWMEVKSDGDIVFKNVLPKKSKETWKAKEKIELWVGKSDVLELVLNGIPLDSPGRGVKKGILITHEGMKLPK